MTFRQFLAVVEIRTKVISVSTYLVATFYAAAAGARVSAIDAALLLIAVLSVDMGTTAFNSFYDFVRGVDDPLFSMEPGKVLVHEGVAPAHALLVSLGLYAVAAAAGLAVAALSSWWILVAGIAGMLVGFLYNGGPLPVSRTPFGEVFAGGFLGSVLFLVVYGVHAGSIDVRAVVASLPGTLLIAAVLTVNNTCDLDGDREAGRRTLSIVLGRGPAEAMLISLVGLAYALMVFMGIHERIDAIRAEEIVFPLSHWSPALIGAGAVLTAVILAGMHRRGYGHDTKNANMSAIIRVMALYTIVYSLSLGFAIVR